MSTEPTPHIDAFGAILAAQYSGRDVQEIEERSDGFINVGTPAGYYYAEYEDWLEHERLAITLAKGRILDIGCGLGRHALYLQKQGFELVCVDESDIVVDLIKKRGLAIAHAYALERLPQELGKFDSILLLGNNLGLLRSAQTSIKILKELRKLCERGAVLLGESMDISTSSNPIHVRYQKENVASGRMPGQIRMRIRYSDIATPWFDYLLMSKPELENILKGTGWSVERYFDANESPGRYIAAIRAV